MMRLVMSCAMLGTLILLAACARTQDSSPAIAETPAPAVRGDLGRWTQHYENRVAEFEAENAELDPAMTYYVFVGDSLTEGFPLERYFPDQPVLNRGIVADGTTKYPRGPVNRGVISRLNESILDTQPRTVFLLIGTNDLPDEDIPLWYWIGAYEEIIDRTLAVHPNVQFVLHTLPPVGEAYKRHAMLNPRIRDYNELIREVAERRGLPLIEVYDLYVDENGMLESEITGDGLHITKDAYARWAEEIRPYLE